MTRAQVNGVKEQNLRAIALASITDYPHFVSMKDCDPQDIAIKSLFLGPQAENEERVRENLESILGHWFSWRRELFADDPSAITEMDQKSDEFLTQGKALSENLQSLIERYRKEIPFYSPRHISHMVSEVSLPAIFGHLLNLLHNPNNVTIESSRISQDLETEAVELLLDMMGFDPKMGQGHFTSCGTIANIEALWRARFRLDRWVAAGSYLKSKGHQDGTLFEIAHQGWDHYHQMLDQCDASEADLKEFSFVASSPWKFASRFEKLFGHPFEGPIILVPANKHYSWPKANSLLGLGEDSFRSIALDETGRMSVEALEEQIEWARKNNRPIAMVVSVAGTTEVGQIDPIDKVQNLLDKYREEQNISIWHHIDAAYGGFMASMVKGDAPAASLSTENANSLRAIPRADSVTVDPHKLGYVPYGAGAILFADPQKYKVSSFQAPYIRSGMSDRWLKTLEGSRSASGAVATLLSMKTFGYGQDGYGRLLSMTVENRKQLEQLLSESSEDFHILPDASSNILAFSFAPKGATLSGANAATEKLYKQINESKEYLVSKTIMRTRHYDKLIRRFIKSWEGEVDTNEIFLIRIVLMNPFFSSKETLDYGKDFAGLVQRLAAEK
ncbi:decarboxylase [Myxococcota bacterium]|nr:decarboxylase [Myxococcota bacterium]